MLPGTTHDHIDLEYTLFEEEGGEEPGPEESETEFLKHMAAIVGQLTRIADALETSAND